MPTSSSLPHIPKSALRVLGIDSLDVAAALVSCGKAKRSESAFAKDMYISTLFRRSYSVAENLAPAVFILSAKHGLLRPNQVIEPYDLFMKKLVPSDKRRWGEQIEFQLGNLLPENSNVLFLGGRDYLDQIEPYAQRRSWSLIDPFKGLGLFQRTKVLARVSRIFQRRDKALQLYAALRRAGEKGNVRPMGSLLSERSLPQRGVYIFSDPRELSSLDPDSPRIVRIGTHAITATSKSILRQRLRTHQGRGDGGGSHRSSVFRLHVGNALRSRHQVEDAHLDMWGKGSSASQDVLTGEADLEQEVSGYIKELMVTLIPLEDAPSPQSLRAIVEKSLIALMTEGHDYLEAPQSDWLGCSSPREEISSSGLWNLQHLGQRTDFKAVDLAIAVLDSYDCAKH